MVRKTPRNYEREVEHALRAARHAGDLLTSAFHRGFPTDVDKQIDETIRSSLQTTFPDYGYRGEELGLASLPQDQDKHLWLVDPQDGTSAAKRGFRGAAVSIALLRDGTPVLGVVHAYGAPDD